MRGFCLASRIPAKNPTLFALVPGEIDSYQIVKMLPVAHGVRVPPARKPCASGRSLQLRDPLPHLPLHPHKNSLREVFRRTSTSAPLRSPACTCEAFERIANVRVRRTRRGRVQPYFKFPGDFLNHLMQRYLQIQLEARRLKARMGCPRRGQLCQGFFQSFAALHVTARMVLLPGPICVCRHQINRHFREYQDPQCMGQSPPKPRMYMRGRWRRYSNYMITRFRSVTNVTSRPLRLADLLTAQLLRLRQRRT